MKYIISRGSQLPEEQLLAIHRLRYNVFCDRLGWDIPAHEQMERDAYDTLDPVFVAAVAQDGHVAGCCRILPTSGPYMLRDTFPILLGDTCAPRADTVWEISRFAVDKTPRHGISFSEIPANVIAHVVSFALDKNIVDYVTVTTVAFERLIKRMNISYERLSNVEQIGIERSVGLMMHVNAQTVEAVSAIAPWMFGKERRVA